MFKLVGNVGPMGAMKTALLLARVYEIKNHDETNALLLKPEGDKKGDRFVVSRLGIKREVEFLIKKRKGSLRKKLKEYWTKYNGFKIIFVDESQFLSNNNIDELISFALEKEIEVHFYFLQGDFLGKMFPPIVYLLPKLNEIVHYADLICPYTGKDAVINIRLVNGEPVFDGPQVAIDEEGKEKPTITYKTVDLGYFLKLKSEWDKKQKS